MNDTKLEQCACCGQLMKEDCENCGDECRAIFINTIDIEGYDDLVHAVRQLKISDREKCLATYLKNNFIQLTGMTDHDWIDEAKHLFRLLKSFQQKLNGEGEP